MIRLVVFDVGDVVCRFEPQRRLDALSAHTKLLPERIHDAIWGSGLDASAERGELDPGELERMVLAALDNRIDDDSLRAAWSSAFVPDARIGTLIGLLELPCYAFTNNGPMFTQCLAHELRDLDAMFRRVICSWEVGACKPDPLAFERLCGEVQCAAEHVLFVDDNRDNVAAARSVGLDAIPFTGIEQLAADLDTRAISSRAAAGY